jgi:hypothetical protein
MSTAGTGTSNRKQYPHAEMNSPEVAVVLGAHLRMHLGLPHQLLSILEREPARAHRREKNCLAWSKAKLESLLANKPFSIPSEGTARITALQSCTGDVRCCPATCSWPSSAKSRGPDTAPGGHR